MTSPGWPTRPSESTTSGPTGAARTWSTRVQPFSPRELSGNLRCPPDSIARRLGREVTAHVGEDEPYGISGESLLDREA